MSDLPQLDCDASDRAGQTSGTERRTDLRGDTSELATGLREPFACDQGEVTKVGDGLRSNTSSLRRATEFVTEATDGGDGRLQAFTLDSQVLHALCGLGHFGTSTATTRPDSAG